MADVEETDEDATTTGNIDEDTTDIAETDAAETDATEDTEADDGGEGEEIFYETQEEDVEAAPAEVEKKPRRKKTWSERCLDQKWKCDDSPLWQIYMNTFVEDQRQLEKDDLLKHRKPAHLRKFPKVQSEEDVTGYYKCLPLSTFQLRDKLRLPDKIDRSKMIRIWKNMRANLPVHSSKSDTAIDAPVSKADSEKWPGMWPCTTRDLAKEILERRRQKRKTRKDLFPCDPDDIQDLFDDPNKDYSDRKELGHARIPQTCPLPTKELLVDRAAGEQPGLVNGDYIVFELPSKARGNRVYADVCLRGLKGMHLPELGLLRTRKNTWKFCFYQAVVALLAKTQLSIELNLILELNDVPIVTDIPWEYEESNMRNKMVLPRKELMNVTLEIGSEKITDQQRSPVHREIKRIEEWFDTLKIRYRNCIFRTTRFSVAFWKDNLFWYLYNPYRCDEFGYFDDSGYACILKFCTKESLKRHLMILLLRAYVYTLPKSEYLEPGIDKSQTTDQSAAMDDAEGMEETEIAGEAEQAAETAEEDIEKFYTIQIYHVTYHCCQIYNLKLLQKGAPKPPRHLVKRKTIDDCPFDPLDVRDPCTIEQEEDDLKETIEKPTWLKLYKITWAKCMPVPQKKKHKESIPGKMRWHQYTVEESNKLFSLWGEIHITDGMFEKENRGMQTYACYVVCAGMTRIMAPEYWSSKILDVIVMCGDRYYTHSKLEAEFKSTKNEYRHVNCWNRYLMSHFKIGETMFEANVLPAICGRLYAKSGKYLWQSLEQMFLKYCFGILTCESSCLGVFKFCGAYYMCDVNSLGPPLFSYGEGAAYLLRATYFQKYITALVLTIGSPECSQFALNPIEILKVIDVGPSVFPVGRSEKKERSKRVTKVECPYDEEKKKQMRKWKHKRAETARTIDKLCCKGGE
ncbi:hypothetical protein ANTPLA_LOCUS4312 [Anthophora plagiata]